MIPDRIAGLVARWVRFYTRDVPVAVARRRIDEIDADVFDHIACERSNGTSERRIALSILSRMVRGISADVSWRDEHTRPIADQPGSGGPMTHRTAYGLAAALALGATLLLVWGVAAMGVVGAEGDPFDLLYISVLVVGVAGALIARFQPRAMVRVLLAMALAQASVAVVALLAGKHLVPVSSVAEILGLNAFFVALFVGSAWLFHRAARGRPSASDGSGR
jgi:hypothetical protein